VRHNLAQHFTPADICRLMLKHIPIEKPKLVIDLAVGQGELLWYAKKKWLGCQVMGFDIDRKLVEHCKSRFEDSGVFECIDVLGRRLSGINNTIISHSLMGGADVVLSNPPFGITDTEDLEQDLSDTLCSYGLAWTSSINSQQVRTEVAFLIRNLQLVREDGYVGMLLPEGIISGAKTERFRRFLVDHTRLHLVLSLPPNSFDSSEARICLVVIQRKAREEKSGVTTHLGIVESETKATRTMTIDPHELVTRMDLKYHEVMVHLKAVASGWEPLGKYLNSCARGYGFYGAERYLLTAEGGLTYLHSTNVADFVIRECREQLTVPATMAQCHPQALVNEGDILFVRVGRGCVGRCAVASTMSSVGFASDCVHILKSQYIDPYYLCLFLNTPFVKRYLNACRRGACSQYITKSDLMALPLFIPEAEVVRRLAEDFGDILLRTNRIGDLSRCLASFSLLTRQLDTLIQERRTNSEQLVNKVTLSR